jgi:hypothetical protein
MDNFSYLAKERSCLQKRNFPKLISGKVGSYYGYVRALADVEGGI